ncbi:E3 ubiquitin-protein ligase RNF19A [Chionoecetes opilio]|uniref:RBR-type E3 ubiquitin transferase n=1 Tax=Chionoecetes opilio TaxID=41210 RepID=A0A8J4YRW9_CHIOP|nr:E3 ubiquitin-protein ligase RNF19A [Chionoecetes opilio]
MYTCHTLTACTGNTDKLTIESEGGSGSGGDSCGGGPGDGGVMGDPPSWSSIRRHHAGGRSLVGSRRGSVGSRGTTRGESCSSEGGACGGVTQGSADPTLTPMVSSGGSPHPADASVATAGEGGRRECPLCLQEVSVSAFPSLLSCPHSACLTCLRLYLTVEITESRVNISCPQCSELMHPSDIHDIVDNALLSFKFEDFMLRRVLSTDPDTRWCPAPDCGYAVVASGCAGCPKLKCERPGCGSYFCYHCKAEWHPNQTCDMARAQRSPNMLLSSFSYLHDIQSSDDVKSCPRCQVLIVKMDDGSCNHMTCSVCGAEFCWLCMKEISDLHYLRQVPSGCTFWGKKPWSRKKKILWQLGTLVGAPLGIGLVAGLAVPAMIIGIPIWVGRKLHARYSLSNPHRRNLAVVGGVTASAVISPVLAGLAVSIGVPILLAYVYGVVPVSLCRSGGCGVTTSASGVRIAFDDENGMVFGLPGRQSEFLSLFSSCPSESSHVGGGTASIGEVSCGASLSADSAAHALAESDRESASTTAIAPASLTGSIASSCISRTNRLEVHVDIAQGTRSTASGETASLAISERSTLTVDTENASMRGLTGSLLQYKVCESENEGELSGTGDSASGVMEGMGHHAALHSSLLHNTDSGSADLRLDSVSAIITARQYSRRHSASGGRGVTFQGDGAEGADHVALTLDHDGENDGPFTFEEGQAAPPAGPSSLGGQTEMESQSQSPGAATSPQSTSPVLAGVHQPHGPPAPHPQRRGRRRRASSAEGKASRSFERPARCESFPKLET